MNNDSAKQLCLDLLRADSEEEVIRILKVAEFWENQACWRNFGDKEDNFSAIGNQQSRPEAALVEKVVNSVDARLMNECQIRGINPESREAPRTIRSAVARFFERREVEGEVGGKIRDWSGPQRTEVSKGITIAATGEKSSPCFTIADTGEGQTPDRMPLTLLSLDKKNKFRIPFVQGKFNMGGTGVLKFCGTQNLQLVVTRRNPAIVSAMKENDSSSDQWGFTIIRRRNPEGTARNSVYTYLAPLSADVRHFQGDVLKFEAPSLPLMPERNEPYKRQIEWGTAIKLYEYHATGFRSHVLRKDGLLYRLEVLLPDLALPIRLHECRKGYGGHEGSYDTLLNGLIVRLDDGKHDNIEPEFPTSVPFEIEGQERQEKFTARIYAFKRGKAETYRKNEGVVLTIDGQTHGILPVSLFARQSVQMGRIADSLLVVVDCSQITGRTREDLFMNSKDRLSGVELRHRLEEEIEDIIRNHDGLKKLREQRKREETEKTLADSKPLEDVLKSILKTSPSLSALFLTGQRLSTPHKSKEVAKEDRPYEGKPHPTFFRFRKLEYGDMLKRACPINRRCRIHFETDVVNDYFDRPDNPGRFKISQVLRDGSERGVTHSLNLHNGSASLSIRIPSDAHVGESLKFKAIVEDDALVERYINEAEITLTVAEESNGGGTGHREPPSNREGKGAEQPIGIEIPRINKIKNEGDNWKKNQFDQYSACRIVQDPSETNPDKSVYEFNINVDNIYLQTEIKASSEDALVLEARFIYGEVLIGLALIRDFLEREKRIDRAETDAAREGEREESIEQHVSRITRALAPFIIPMIKSLGALTEADVGKLSRIGDEE